MKAPSSFSPLRPFGLVPGATKTVPYIRATHELQRLQRPGPLHAERSEADDRPPGPVRGSSGVELYSLDVCFWKSSRKNFPV